MALLITLIILLVYLSISFFITKALFAPDSNYPWAEDEGRRVFFFSGKRKLEGIVFNEKGTKGTVVIAHGMGMSMRYMRPEVIHFQNMGYRVFTFEYTGYGESEGTFLGFRQAQKDLDAALEYIYSPSSLLVLLGHSMGGYSVLSSEFPNISCIVAYAPFRSPFSAMHRCALRMGNKGRILEPFLYPVQFLLYGMKANRSVIGNINARKCPILILQGNEDREVELKGCSLWKKRDKITNENVKLVLVEKDGSNGHVSIVREKGSKEINHNTMDMVDTFLSNTIC